MTMTDHAGDRRGLEGPRPFSSRHVGSVVEDLRHIAETVGVTSCEQIVRDAIPASVLNSDRNGSSVHTPSLPPSADEATARAELVDIAKGNRVTRVLIGRGYYGTLTPPVIRRNILENPSWYTAYTPYQPEISQGRLEVLTIYQQLITDLTGLALANSSLLDEATAASEGMLLARRASRKVKSNRFLVHTHVFDQVRDVVLGHAEAAGIEVVETDLRNPESWRPEVEAGCFGVLAPYPDSTGALWNPSEVFEAVHQAGGIAIAECDVLALTLMTPPGELGADVAIGSSQRFGVPMGNGGPHAAYMSVRAGLERQIPGRLVGVSTDADGNPAYRLALQTREQHIRRDKATSNICTAQVLLAVTAAAFAIWHGPKGLTRIAMQVRDRAHQLASALRAGGLDVSDDLFFDTIRITATGGAKELWHRAREGGYTLDLVDGDTLQIAVDETVTPDELRELAQLLGGDSESLTSPTDEVWPEDLRRTTDFMTHPVFSSYHTETAMMRYLKRLADRDYGLDRGMIPLGSCTMKLNAAAEMEAMTWQEFGQMHPFAPVEDQAGSLRLIRDLEIWLAELTGYDTVSLQPNAGSQGEYTGLAAIRGYHLSRGDTERTVCLVPASAHGTNAASAALAGLKVVVVKSNDDGTIDRDDLAAKIAENEGRIAAIMITYPSTHGVYEDGVRQVCDMVHKAGGQVYIDGANFNALVGWGQFGHIGGDVSHLNLHKTFAIPHGGGGPGVGPVAAKSHLAPFLPGHPLNPRNEHPLNGGGTVTHDGHAVSAAPYGSVSVLPISWAYLRLMGLEGLQFATEVAVLNANYIAHRIQDKIPVLYTGQNGYVAHECILDLRPLTAETGITVDDVAKRLIDYGFHAPTMSFPVAGTLMVEPTESEDLAELDRFCDAMLAIVEEARMVQSGHWPADDNPLVNAPHPAARLVAVEWNHPYSRELGCYPGMRLGVQRDQERGLDVSAFTRIQAKYWPPVGRVDNTYGDRHLVCTCPPPEAFED
ncbi:aminomethyl-transferring glycine dehydrogenase [Cutibacterium avidum]|uniref:aminomethyl-transferring glycine dehydrogenase n=1 Tax=Cutibacterium avidum TaxID=33010 RepID=UPI0008F59407|nr:aminomethyl-transferring glycine dehydrogenase [Cutibacterium avidum]MDK7698913.1 aminomethyl-transferring glycine dehydrogenase [Cutibacterium avidum]OIJ78335.1 glycine dehydrogenase [Cutibacterium avidum]